MKKIIFMSLLVLLSLPLSAFATDIEHTVMKDETPWFLATVFYGKGTDYTKLLATNHLQNPAQMKEGMVIKVENPTYYKTQGDFAQRYTQLWEKRALALEAKEAKPPLANAPQVAVAETSKVTLPVEKIRHKDSLHKLPFAESENSAKSATEKAKEELLKNSRQSSDHGE